MGFFVRFILVLCLPFKLLYIGEDSLLMVLLQFFNRYPDTTTGPELVPRSPAYRLLS
jgi:hypothetical protein